MCVWLSIYTFWLFAHFYTDIFIYQFAGTFLQIKDTKSFTMYLLKILYLDIYL